MKSEVRFISLKTKPYFSLAFICQVLGIEDTKWLSWAFSESEHSIAMVKTQEGLFFEESGTTLIVERRCTKPLLEVWLRTIQKGDARRKLSEAEKKAVAIASKYTCNMCHNLVQDYEIDHIEQHALRQNNERINLQLLCPSCHRKKTRMDRLFGDPLFETQKKVPTTVLVGKDQTTRSSYFYQKKSNLFDKFKYYGGEC